VTILKLRSDPSARVTAGYALFDLDFRYTKYIPWAYHAAIAAESLDASVGTQRIWAIHIDDEVEPKSLRVDLAGFPKTGDRALFARVLDRAKSFFSSAHTAPSHYHLKRYKHVELAEDNWTVIRYTLSCAGLVEWCYEKEGLDLVAEESLPCVRIGRDQCIDNRKWKTVQAFLGIYCGEEDKKEEYYLQTLWPGYQIVALDRDDQYPYQPVVGDEEYRHTG
jgi:hypothetical protein